MSSHGFTVQQREEFREAFDMFASNDVIQNEKLKQVMKNLGQEATDAELDAMIREVDADGSGEIDFDEFLTMMAGCMGDDEAKDAFKCLDNNSSGTVLLEDLKHVLVGLREELTSDELTKVCKELDPSGSGNVALETFKKVFCF